MNMIKIKATFLNKNKFSDIRKKISERNIKFIISVVIMVCAIISGVIIYIVKKDFFDENISKIFSEHINFMILKNNLEIFSGLLTGSIPIFFLILLFSTSFIGNIFISLVSFVKLMSMTTIVSYLYSTYGIKGIEYCLLVFIPGKILLIFSLLLLINYSFYLTSLINRRKYNNTDDNPIIKLVIIIFLFLLGNGIDLLSSKIFLRFFTV